MSKSKLINLLAITSLVCGSNASLGYCDVPRQSKIEYVERQKDTESHIDYGHIEKPYRKKDKLTRKERKRRNGKK